LIPTVPEAVAVEEVAVAVEEVGFPEKVQQVEVGFRPATDRHKELRETEAPSPGAAASEAATSRPGRVLRVRTSKLEAVISRIGRVLRVRTNRIGRIMRARTSRIDRIMRMRIGTGMVRDMEIAWGSLLLLALPVTLLVQQLNRQQLWRHFHAPRQWCALASKATTNVEKIGTKKCILAVV
jgi:hypothetical protein